MKQEHIEKIKGYYDSQSEYKINRWYSGESGIVYTKADDNAHWLVVEQKGGNKEKYARQTIRAESPQEIRMRASEIR